MEPTNFCIAVNSHLLGQSIINLYKEHLLPTFFIAEIFEGSRIIYYPNNSVFILENSTTRDHSYSDEIAKHLKNKHNIHCENCIHQFQYKLTKNCYEKFTPNY